jgi:hypothetical protein
MEHLKKSGQSIQKKPSFFCSFLKIRYLCTAFKATHYYIIYVNAKRKGSIADSR